MKTSLFDFDLPESLIATRPASPRDSARMLVLSAPPPAGGRTGGGQALQDCTVRELPNFLREGDVVVFNDTRVIPARLYGKRGEVEIELLLHKAAAPPDDRGQITDGKQKKFLSSVICHPPTWKAFARPAKRLKPGDRIVLADDFFAEVLEKHDGGEVLLQFSAAGADFYTHLNQYGHMPLPPYIERKREADAQDTADYQTCFARDPASVAAPTAGLHFTDAMFAALKNKGVNTAFVTLHVGAGTFLPVKAEDTDDHVMHSEFAVVNEETARLINATKARGGRIIAVGTTSLRTLESAAAADGSMRSFTQETDIFITPGYRFKCVDMLLTNFHLPKSTLFMLVSAFAGTERMKAAYAHAITQRYRFYSYGDACLLMRA